MGDMDDNAAGELIDAVTDAALEAIARILHLNVDSMTEMAEPTARAYVDQIQARADMFLSINHEANGFTVREVAKELGQIAVSREAYWMRHGYVEEMFMYPDMDTSSSQPVYEYRTGRK